MIWTYFVGRIRKLWLQWPGEAIESWKLSSQAILWQLRPSLWGFEEEQRLYQEQIKIFVDILTKNLCVLVMLGLKTPLRSSRRSAPLTRRLLHWDRPSGVRLPAGGEGMLKSLGFLCDCFMLQFFDFEQEYLFCDVTSCCTSALTSSQ